MLIFVTPVNGAQITDPATGFVLPPAGKLVEYSQYWQRRINEGGVTQSNAPTAVNSAPIRQPVSFATMADFNNAGGAAAYGVGPVWIAGNQYWCDGVNLYGQGGSMSLVVEYLINNATANAGNPFILNVPATKAGGLMFIDGAGGGGGGGAGFNGANWSSGGGGGSSACSCMQFAVRIPPTTTRLAIVVGAGGAAGVIGSVGAAGGNGGNGGATIIYDPDITLSGAGNPDLLRLYGGNGGSGGATAQTGGVGGILGAPSYGTGAGSSGVNAVGGTGTNSVTSIQEGMLGYFLQVGGGGGGGTDGGSVAQKGGDTSSIVPWVTNSGIGGSPGGTNNWKAGGGAGGGTCFANLFPGYFASGGTLGLTPYHAPSIPGFGGGGGAGSANGANGADGIVRIYW